VAVESSNVVPHSIPIPWQQSREARLAIDFSTGYACVSHASGVLRRVRNDNFSSTLVERLNAGERNSSSLVRRDLAGGFLGRLGKA
jgi:hypothetical protein